MFLDYDGTLAPIAALPSLATLAPGARETVRALAQRWPVAIISGRDLHDVQSRVGIPELFYAGSHGLEIAGPGGWQEEHGFAAIPALNRAEAAVRQALAGVPGVVIERKRLALAVHHRQVDPRSLPQVERAVAGAIADEPDLRRGLGKRVFEIRPDIGWNKGTAAWRILEVHERPPGRDLPIYIGDDLTDEDAFAFAVQHGGLAIVVGSPSWATAATHRLADPDEVVRFLQALLAEPA